MPPKMFPLQGLDTIPDGYKGWLLFFDEINAAPRSVQAAAYKIVLEREVGLHKLHKQCHIVCAGNLMTDGAITNEMGTALRSRLVHIHVETDAEQFLNDVAPKLNFDSRVIAYLNYQKHKLNNFAEYQANSADETFSCQRTWEFASKLCKVVQKDESKPIPLSYGPLLQGTVGSAALEFVQFTQALDGLVQYKDVIKDPEHAPIPDKPAVQYLLVSMLSGNVTEDTLTEVSTYLDRLPQEIQFIFIRVMVNRCGWCMSNAAFLAQVSKVGFAVYG